MGHQETQKFLGLNQVSFNILITTSLGSCQNQYQYHLQLLQNNTMILAYKASNILLDEEKSKSISQVHLQYYISRFAG